MACFIIAIGVVLVIFAFGLIFTKGEKEEGIDS